MKHRDLKSIVVLASVGLLWLLVSCTPGTSIESGDNTQPADASASAATPGEEQTDAKPDDIIDRVLSPLDNAVSDINRDLNKGDADTPSEPNE